MKKKLVIVVSLLLFLIFLNFLSDFVIVKAQNLLERKVLSALPEGSHIKEIKLEGLTGVSVDSIYIKDIGSFPKVEVTYSPLGIVRRRVKKLSLFSPSLAIIAEGKEGGKRGSISALFYVEEFEVLDGSVEYKGHKYLVNGNGRVFSTGRGEIVLDVPKLWGSIDDTPFNIEEINLSVSDRISSINVQNLKIGNSEFEVRSDINGTIMGSGRVYMSDLQQMFGLTGEGFLDVIFTYDSTITFKGESKIVSIKEFGLPPFTFSGEKDSVNLKGEKVSGFLNFGKGIYGQVELVDFDIKEIDGKYPDSKISGLIDFSYRGKDTLQITSRLSGEVLSHPIEDLKLRITKKGKKIFVDSCEGRFNNGKFFFEGVYGDKIDGNLEIENLDISPIAKFLRLETSAVLNIGLSIHEKIYGAFSLKALNYKGINFKSIEGNVNLSQKKGTFPGLVTFVSRDIAFKDRKIFELGEASLEITDGKLDIKGIFKSKKRKVNSHFSLNADTVEIKVLRLEYSGGWLSLTEPFSFTYKHAFHLKDVRFLSNRGADLQINSISLSETGIRGDLDFIGFRPEILSEFGIVSHPFSGNLSSRVSIEGTLNAPMFTFEGGGKIKAGEVSIGDSLNFNLGFEDNRFFVNDLSIIENGNLSNFKGTVDTKKHSINLDIKLQEAGSWIFYPLMSHLIANSAKAVGKLKIRGSFEEPLVYGGINLRETDLLVKNSGIMINKLEAKAVFDGYGGELATLSALLGEGKIQAEGKFKLRDKGFNINVKLRNTPITWQYVNSLIDGDLLVIKDKENVRIEGDVELKRATITMQFKQQDGKGGRRPANLFLDLNFDATQGNVWVRNDLANIELTGKVGVNYKGGPFLVSGNLEVRQGMFYYLYKSFEVTEGKFNFNESPEINPNIDIKAITLISSRSGEKQEQDTVYLVVSGTMKTPEFDLYSKSSLSKAEIMTLLSLNLGWEDLTSVKSIEQSVTETAFNYWVRQTLNRRLKDEFGIDVLEMQGVSGHYEFVVGKYVTDKLFVKARTDVQSYGISEVQAEYKLKKWGYITAEKDFLGKTRFLFNFEWRY